MSAANAPLFGICDGASLLGRSPWFFESGVFFMMLWVSESGVSG